VYRVSAIRSNLKSLRRTLPAKSRITRAAKNE
jgi:hypothetical protein